MREALARTGLLLPAVLAEAAAALLTLAPQAAVPVLAAAVLAGLLAAARRARLVLAALAACAAVALSVSLHDAARHPVAVPTGRPVAALVRVDSLRSVATNDHAGALASRLLVGGTLLRAGPHAGLAAPVLLFTDRVPAAARIPSATVTATLVLRTAQPGDDVAYLASVLGGLRLAAPADPVQATAAALRAGLVRRSAALAGDGGALLPGLAIGDVSRVPAGLDQAMKDASLSHLTAVSGANCAVITVAVFVLAGLLRLPRLVRILAAAAALLAFVVLVTPQPSVLRAAVMALIALGCLAMGRTAAGVPALSAAVVVLVVLDPWLARSAGFVLSVLATAGLLLLTRPIAARLTRILPRSLALALAVPIAAQVACEPVLVLLQPAVPLFGVLANLLAEPAAAPATVLGLLACLALPVVPALGGGLAQLAWAPAAWIAAVARAAAGLPALPWLSGAGGSVLAFGGLVAVVLALARRLPLPVRAAGTAAALLLAVTVTGAVGGGAVARIVATPADWEVAACDVGQGDGLVVNGGGGHVAVIDTGREPAPIRACLARLGIGRIDLLVLTHYDTDHVGAARSLAGRAGTVFVGPSDGPAADALRRAMGVGGARVLQVHRGDAASVGRLRIHVLWPEDPLGEVGTGNPASITLLVTGRLSSIFTGDLGEAAQNALLAAGPLPAADVVKVAHHGSADQSPAFYAALGASVGLISCGAGNDYHHPTARLLRILRQDRIQPVRTDQSGLLLVAPATRGVRVWTERPLTAAVWTPGA